MQHIIGGERGKRGLTLSEEISNRTQRRKRVIMNSNHGRVSARDILRVVRFLSADNRHSQTSTADTRPRERNETADPFKALRQRAHFTQSRLGELIDTDRQTVSRIENLRAMPHRTTWERFVELESAHIDESRVRLSTEDFLKEMRELTVSFGLLPVDTDSALCRIETIIELGVRLDASRESTPSFPSSPEVFIGSFRVVFVQSCWFLDVPLIKQSSIFFVAFCEALIAVRDKASYRRNVNDTLLFVPEIGYRPVKPLRLAAFAKHSSTDALDRYWCLGR